MRLLLCLTLLLLILGSCVQHQSERPQTNTQSVCDSTNYSYSADVAPIFALHCNSCHTAPNGADGFNTDNYADVSADIKALLEAMKEKGGRALMPPNSKLPDSVIHIIECWNYKGAQNN